MADETLDDGIRGNLDLFELSPQAVKFITKR